MEKVQPEKQRSYARGKWYITKPEEVAHEAHSKRIDCGIVIAGPRGEMQLIGEFYGRSGPFIKNDAAANAARAAMCVNALNGFEDPMKAILAMEDMMLRCEAVSKAFVEVLALLPEYKIKPEWIELRKLQTS